MQYQQPPLFSAASDLTQRWREGRSSWRPAYKDTAFASHLYHVEPIPESLAKPFVVTHHYAHSFPAAIQCYGLCLKEVLVGVAVLSSPVRREVLTSVFPDLLPYSQSVELSRFVLLDAIEGNSESWFLARMFRLAEQRGVRGIVSFSDPTPRYLPNGEILTSGHVGTIYKATNALYLSTTDSRLTWVLPDGTYLHERTRQKIRRGESGAGYGEELLIKAGATPRRDSEDRARWLKEALVSVGAHQEREEKKHRYAFPLGTKRERRSLRIGKPAMPYPKSTFYCDRFSAFRETRL